MNISLFRGISKSLSNSNLSIEYQIREIHHKLIKDTSGPIYSEKAKFWLAKAINVSSKSDSLYNYLDSLKLALKGKAQYHVIDQKEYWNENDYSAMDELFFAEGQGSELYARLFYLKNSILDGNYIKDSTFKNSISKIVLGELNNENEFSEIYFENLPAIGGLTVLQKFENDVRNFELATIAYLYDQVPQ